VAERALDVNVTLAGPASDNPTGQHAEKSAPPSQARAIPTFVPWVVAGTGVLALGAAGVYELKRQGAESDARWEQDQGHQPGYYDDLDRMSSYQTTARVFLGVGTALLVTGGVLAFVNQPTTVEQPQAPPPVAFGCDGETCAGLWRGTF